MDREPLNKSELQLLIQLLEAQQKSALIELETEVHGLAKSFHPLNLIKSTLQNGSFLDNILDLLKGSAMGAGSGFMASKLFGRQQGHPIRRFLSSTAILALSNLVLKNPAILSTGVGMVVDLVKGFAKNAASSKKDEGETD